MASALASQTQANSQPSAASKPAAAPPKTANSPIRSVLLQNTTPALRLSNVLNAAPRGEPLSASVRAPIERSFGMDLSPVRVHTGNQAARAAGDLSARAFTLGNDIFLGSGERPNDLGLMAHEAAHVVQQQSVPAVQKSSLTGQSDSFEPEANQASAAVLSGEPFTVRERTGGARVQRLGISDALNYFADKANLIPGFRMFTIILGVNPVNMSRVERSAANILRALIEFIPGGGLITQALDNYGIFDRIGNWVEQQVRTLGMTGSLIRQAINEFLNSLSWSDIFDLGGVWNRAKRIFTEPINRIISFAGGLVTGIIGFIKDAILQPLARLAEGTRGWDLLTAVLGRNPITGDAVPRNADTLIGGFMKLIGQEEIWNNLKRANAVARAWAWFQGALGGLLSFVTQIPSLFIQALQSLELADIVLLPRAFVRVGRVFGSFLGQFFSWAGQQVMSLLQIIFEVVAPSVMPYLRRAAAAFRTIIQNPIGFVGNLVRAGIQGFRQFAGNFLTHLRASLIGWLTGTLSGANIYIPQGFNLREILKFVLSVLGLTWQNIRGKLVRVIGETAVRALEIGFDLVVTLVRQGPAAAWQQIMEGISNLREMVMEQVMNFVRDRIVQAAITRLLTSLNPAGAFIQAIIAIYNTIMFFVERLRQIAQVVASFIDSISAIASGVIAAAASRVERTMAGLLTLVVSFLARIAGLGRVSDAVINIINRVRAPIDRALDRVVNWIVTQARRLLQRIRDGLRRDQRPAAQQAEVRPGQMTPIVVPFQMSGAGHTLTIREGASGVELLMASGQSLPLTTTFQGFYTELDDWRHFLESIRNRLPVELQRQIDAKITHLRNIRQTQIRGYQEIYERTWGSRRGGEGHQDPNREREAVRQLTERANADLASIRQWAAQTEVQDLSPEAIRTTLRRLGAEAFRQAVDQRRQAVDRILSAFRTPNGSPVEYRGSLAEGQRGPHKAGVRFNPDDFDLDLYVIDPALHADILRRRPQLRAEFANRPIPASTAGGAASTLQRAVVAALEAPGAVPGLRAGANYILVRLG